MSCVQAVQPLVGEVLVRPTLVVGPPSPATAALPFTQKATQTAAEPAVQVQVDVPVTMPKVPKPSLQRPVQGLDDPSQAMPVGAARSRTYGVLELDQALLARQPQHASKSVTQKVKTFRPCVHDLRFGRMQ